MSAFMPATLRLSKHHGLGNDFLVVLDQPADADLARRLCDRRTGIGADGLIVGTAGGPGGADLTMVLYNADGSRAEMSGNGIRCLAQAWVREHPSSDGQLRIATDAGARPVTVVTTVDPATVQAHVDMGKALPGPDLGQLVLDAAQAVTVDVGNPHLVLLVDDVVPVDVDADGPFIELGIEGGINVEWIAPDPDTAGRLDLRVWERGAGHTLACGTGACAAAHAAHAWGLVGERVTVAMEGGEVEVVLGDTITLIGPATFVADITVEQA
jgi:diaminopimelate epimerase